MLPACPVPVPGPSFKRALRLAPHRPSPWACQPFCLRAASLLCCHAFLCLVCCARPGNVRCEPALAGGLGPVHHWLRTAGLRTGWLSGSDSPKLSRLPLRQAISALPTRNEQEYYHLPPTTHHYCAPPPPPPPPHHFPRYRASPAVTLPLALVAPTARLQNSTSFPHPISPSLNKISRPILRPQSPRWRPLTPSLLGPDKAYQSSPTIFDLFFTFPDT